MIGAIVLIHIGRLPLGHTIKTNFIIFQTVDPQTCSILMFLMGLGLVSPPRFLYDFSRIFLILYSINWQSFIVWLRLLLEILGNICIVIICCWVNLFIRQFFYVTKKSGRSLIISTTKRAFNIKSKSFFIIFKGLLLNQIKLTSLEGEIPTLSFLCELKLFSLDS